MVLGEGADMRLRRGTVPALAAAWICVSFAGAPATDSARAQDTPEAEAPLPAAPDPVLDELANRPESSLAGAASIDEQHQDLHFPPGMAYSVDDTIYLDDEPSADSFVTFIVAYSDDVRRLFPGVQLRYRQTGSSVRLDLVGLRGLVIVDHRYWEAITLHVTFARTDRTHRNEYADRVPVSSLYGGQESPLGRAARARRPIYQLTYVLDGRFAAGGRPSRLQDYTNMEGAGYRDQMEYFIQRVQQLYGHHRSNRSRGQYDLWTGQSAGRDLMQGD
ncbi:MAG TPA: hypothetical protein VJS15_07500 [Allosphingosinicella sp.]|nr:hypothetical protein [Allosphingosinicella sp.]